MDRVLTGGLNLLASEEKLAPGESRQLENFRVDQEGVLRSRKGLVADATGLGARVHSLFRSGNDRYGGVGTELRLGPGLGTTVASGFDGEPLAMVSYQDLTWAMNRGKQVKAEGANASNFGIAAPAGAPVATPGAQATVAIAEFDSIEDWELTRWSGGVRSVEPDAEVLITSQGTVSVTQGSVNVVGQGTNWTPDMAGKNIRIDSETPGVYNFSVIAAVADATHLTLIAGYAFSTRSSRAYQITETRPAKSYDDSNKVSGTHSLLINCNPAARWQVEREFGGIDTRINGQANADDQFRFWIYCENSAAVKVKVTLFSGTGGVRQAVTATVAASTLNPAQFSWTQAVISRSMDPYAVVNANPDYQDLLRRMSEQEGNSVAFDALNQQRVALFNTIVENSPFFRSVTAPVGTEFEFDWEAVTGVWIEAEVTEPTVVHFDKAEMVGGLPGSLEGEFSFFVTFENGFFQESTAGPGSESVVLHKQAVTLSEIPTSPDAQVRTRHIYGIGGALNVPLRFGTLNNNTATTLNLTVDLDRVQRDKIEMPEENDPPPAARGMMGPYFGRLVAWSSAEHPARMWWTEVAKPWAWPGAADSFEGNWIDAGASEDALLWCSNHERWCGLYKQRSIWRQTGDPDGPDPERTHAEGGIVGPQAGAEADGGDYIVMWDGVYFFNGQTRRKISSDLDPLFVGDAVRIAGDITTAPVTVDHRDKCVLAYSNGELRLSYPEQGQSSPNVTLVYEVASERWGMERSAAGGFTALYFEGGGPSHGLIGGTANGALYQVGDRATDAGAAIALKWQSGFLDQGLPDNDKPYSDLVIDFQTAMAGETPSALTVKMAWPDRTIEAIGSISSSGRQVARFRLGTNGQGRKYRMAAPRIEGDATSTCLIYGVWLHWYGEPRWARSFDTGPVRLSGASADQVDLLEVKIESLGPVHWAVWSDLPGGMIASRVTGTLAVSNGLATIPVRPSTIVDGRLWRFLAWSDSDFKLWNLRVRHLPIGEYIDGAAGQYWESRPGN